MSRHCVAGILTGRHSVQLLTLCVVLAASASPVARADDDAVATVDGQPITRKALFDILIDSHGAEVLQQMIILQVAKQETQRRGLRVTQADVDAEFDDALNRIAADAGMTGEYATDKNKRAALQQVLDERRISMAEFKLGMERNAYLRKLVEKDLRVTEETLREEFARTYGERVQVAHIQIDQHDSRTLNTVVDLLNHGADFGDIARQYSVNAETAARGGEMEPFTFNDPNIPPALREAAFSLKEGGVSNPVLAGQYFHILKLLRRIPTTGARFEDVRDEIEKSVRQRATPQAMSRLAMDLYKQAKVTVLDGALRAKYQEFLEKGAAAPAQP